MGPFTRARRWIHRDHDNGTIRSVGCLHVIPALHVDYVEGIEGLVRGYLDPPG